MNLKEQREAKVKAAQELITKAREGSLTADERKSLDGLVEEAKALSAIIEKNNELDSMLEAVPSAGVVAGKKSANDYPATLGHFAFKQLADNGTLGGIKSGAKLQASTTEYKAAGDPTLVPAVLGGTTQLLLPDIDKNIVRRHEQSPTIASWLGAGTVASNALTYFVEKAWEASTNGKFTTVAEGAAKPGMTPPSYDQVTETLKKIAGWIKLSTEMAEDADFLISEINNRLLFQLTLAEEDQLLNGDGVGTNLKGLLLREGLQTHSISSAAGNIDGIYEAMNKVYLKTGLRADGIVINPADYQQIRLSKDGNQQYYAGGPFMGQYGVGGVLQDPPIWGIPVIQTTAVTKGTVLLGAGKQAATVYRKGGLRVEAANVDRDDYTKNLFTVLAEERLLLAVRRPDAFVKVTLGA